jgi:hypothetical protein
VDAAREQHVELGGFAPGRQPAFDHPELPFPQGVARPRAGVAAALEALEHEAAGAVGEEALEQAGCGHVQERANAGLLQLGGLRRPAPGDQRQRRSHLADHGQLLVAQVLGDEAEHAHSPGSVAQPGRGLLQQRPDLALAAQERQRQEWQSATVGDRLGEGGPVGHAGHRALDHGVGRAGGGRHTGARGQRLGPPRGGDVLADLAAQPGHQPADAAVAGGELRRQGRVLPRGQGLLTQRGSAQARREVARGAAVVDIGDPQVGPGVDAVAGDHPRLAAVHGRQGQADRAGQG